MARDRHQQTLSERREAVKTAYKNQAWAERVKEMTEEQVTAIYLRLKAQNKI